MSTSYKPFCAASARGRLTEAQVQMVIIILLLTFLGHVIVQCLAPVPTKGMTLEDIPKLIEQVRGSMESTYDKLTNEVFSGLPKDYQHTSVG